MSKCDVCINKKYCANHLDARTMCPQTDYVLFTPSYKTNYDRLISKTPEELAEWLADILNHCENKRPEELCRMSCPLYKCCNDQPSDNIEDWLKSPVEVEK